MYLTPVLHWANGARHCARRRTLWAIFLIDRPCAGMRRTSLIFLSGSLFSGHADLLYVANLTARHCRALARRSPEPGRAVAPPPR